MKEKILLISIDRIRILNPRYRDRKKFEIIVQSIKSLGLKKPIQVSLRSSHEDHEPGYDLVCGQGRIEAFVALGYKEIPAVVVEVSKEERLLRSLVENMARRFPMPADLLNEIERLKGLGYSNVAIGKKLDMADSTVGGYLALRNAGEERLLISALTGRVPLGVAIDIAKADNPEDQRALLKAFESKQLTGVSIRVVKRLMEHRRFFGKQKGANGNSASRLKTSADGMVNAYKKESQRQKLVIRKANLCDAKLRFITQTFTKLTDDEGFINLLQTEGLQTMPKFLAGKIAANKVQIQ